MTRHLKLNFWTVQTLGWGIFTLTNFVTRWTEDGLTNQVILAVPIIFVLGMIITGFFRWFIRRRRWYTKPLGRILLHLMWAVPVLAFCFAFLVVLPGAIMDDWSGTVSEFFTERLLGSWLSSCIILFGWSGLYFAYHFFLKFREAEVQRWKIQAVLHESRLNALKSQVNPHFLFNSLNSLSALIDIDTGRAKQFVDDLSASYRYLLQASEQPLVPLSTELGFLKSYFNLLKTRHGEGVQLDIELPDNFPDLQIPPLTLQLLVENAVKHNMVSTQKPLIIKICSEKNNGLAVSNNVQKKSTAVQSTKTGLANITEKYRLLGKPSVEIVETPAEFKVCIPLL